MNRIVHIGSSLGVIALAAVLMIGAGAFMPQALSRPGLDALAIAVAFDDIPQTRRIETAALLDGGLGPVPDGALLGSAALADLLLAERAGMGRERPHLEAARADLIAQARITPADPYVWARLASVELALGAGNARVAKLLSHSMRLGRNASGAWPARVAIGFRIWPDAPTPLRADILQEAARMWHKRADRHWDRRAMQDRLADMALTAGMADRLAPLIASAPEDFARWNFIIGERAALR